MTELVLYYLLGRPLACPPHLLGSHQALPSLSSTSLLHPHCRPPSHLGSSTRPVPQGTTGTALAPGSGHLLWYPCIHPGAAGLGCQTQGSAQCGNRRAHQGEDLLPQEKQSSRWLGQLVFETCSFGSKSYPIGPWPNSPPGTQVLATDRHSCSLHTCHAQWCPAVLLRRKGCFVDLRAGNLARAVDGVR